MDFILPKPIAKYPPIKDPATHPRQKNSPIFPITSSTSQGSVIPSLIAKYCFPNGLKIEI